MRVKLSLLFLFFFLTSFSQDIQVEKLKKNIYLHTSYFDYKGSKVGSNGLILVGKDGVLIIDTPWDDPQSLQLVRWIEKNIGKPVKGVISTHSHKDRTGGANTFKKLGIPVMGMQQTKDLAAKEGFPVDSVIVLDPVKKFTNPYPVTVLYPGQAHAPDNIVIFIEKEKLLFGGCMIKAGDATDLGNIADANLKEWPGSITNIKKTFPKINIVIPGHGKTGDLSLLDHTLNLVKAGK
jgi:metallo-beta-lactamase class B